MYATVITANDVSAKLIPFVRMQGKSTVYNQWVRQPVQPFVIMHEKQMMVGAEVVASMVEKWKSEFHPSERPITEGMQDAPLTFLNWLAKQPFGYVIPETNMNLTSLPIFDEVSL